MLAFFRFWYGRTTLVEKPRGVGMKILENLVRLVVANIPLSGELGLYLVREVVRVFINIVWVQAAESVGV